MTYPYLPTRWLITTPDLANDPDVFPLLKGQDFLSQKSPTFPPTIVRRSISGREIRASFGDIPFWQFKVGYGVIRDRPPTQNELQRLFAFFASHQGQLGSFFYFDPDDNVVTDCQFGVGDGVTTTFQLQRQIGAGTVNAYAEPVYILNGTPTVKKAGVGTTDFTIGSFGSITFGTAPAASAALTWSGSFMFLCRFGADQIDPGQMVKGLWSLSGIDFTSWIPL